MVGESIENIQSRRRNRRMKEKSEKLKNFLFTFGQFFSYSTVFIIFFVFLCLSAYAVQTDSPVIIQSIRTQSLGGAFTAVADSEELFFFNPSGLQSIEDSRLTMFGIRANFNADTISEIKEFAKAYDKANSSKELSRKSISSLGEYEPLISLGAPIQITYIRPHFGFMLLNPNMNAQTNFSFSGAKNESSVKIKNMNDLVAMVAYGRRIYRDLSAGLTLKYLVRTEIGRGEGTELADLVNGETYLFLRRGLGYDFGLMYELDRWSLKFGLNIRDLFGTNLTEDWIDLNSGDIIDRDIEYKIKRQTTFGISYQPDFKIPFRRLVYYPEDMIFALDIGGGDSFSKVRFGSEIKFFRWLALRFGFGKGIRLGLGIQTGTVQLDYMFSPKMTDAYLDKETENNHAFSLLLRY